MNGEQGTQPIAPGAEQGGMPFGGPPGGGPPGGGFPGGGRGGGMFLLGPWGGMAGIVLLVLTYAVMAFAVWKFLSKAGLTPAVALLMLVPVVNLGVVVWAAFTEWPALKEVARLRERVATYELQAMSASAREETPAPLALE